MDELFETQLRVRPSDLILRIRLSGIALRVRRGVKLSRVDWLRDTMSQRVRV